MERAEVPQYAVFEDYRSSQRVAVVVRWFILVTWLVLINYRSEEADLSVLNTLGGAVIVLNGYVHWRILKGSPITWPYVLALSLMDLSIITVGVLITSRFENTFFIFYYPALVGVALIFPRRISFAVVTVLAGIYTGMSVAMEPGLDTSVLFDSDEKQLVVRVVCMFAIVVAANLMTRLERERRREAVDAERARIEENIQLQHRAQEAEREIQRERIRISQEIHDGAAQSAYVLSLGLDVFPTGGGEQRWAPGAAEGASRPVQAGPVGASLSHKPGAPLRGQGAGSDPGGSPWQLQDHNLHPHGFLPKME